MKNKNKSDEPTIQNYVNKESPIELPRRSILKGAIAATVTTFMSGFVSRDAMADSNPNQLKPGVLLQVLSSTGVRAGVLTQTSGTNEPITMARKAFATKNAYDDPGYWFFFYQKDGLVGAVRILKTKHSKTEVGYTSLGHSTTSGPQLISSLGRLTFNGTSLNNRFECRIQAHNYYDTDQVISSNRNCSSYFLNIQQLVTVKSRNISAANRAKINAVINRDIIKLGLDPVYVKYLT